MVVSVTRAFTQMEVVALDRSTRVGSMEITEKPRFSNLEQPNREFLFAPASVFDGSRRSCLSYCCTPSGPGHPSSKTLPAGTSPSSF